MIGYGKQTIDQSDIESLLKVFEGNWLTQGPYVENFENDLANYFGCKSACAVNSGTAALHLAGLALGWGEDDIVITSPITFLASANSIIYCGATPDFVDIDYSSYTIDLNKLEEKINYLSSKNKRVKSIIAVDYAGHPCDWSGLKEIANRYEITLVNDNCHAIGASYLGNKTYSAKYADLVTQSYHPVKNITTGEGGSVLTNFDSYDKKIRLLRTHGMTKEKKSLIENEGPWFYEMHEVGYNYRITDFQCALGSNQLRRLDEFIIRRREIANIYDVHFQNIEGIKIPLLNNDIMHAYHLYPLQIDFNKFSIDKVSFFKEMYNQGINLQVHYIPVHLQPYYKDNYSFQFGDFSVAEDFYEKEVSLPIYPDLKNHEIKKVVNSIKKILS